jgi:quercetin dioxygenase-like cupin family protein
MIAARAARVALAAAVTVAVAACGSGARRAAHTTPMERLSPLIQLALPDVPGRTFTAATVDFPPGARAAPHRHGRAFVYAYVLEGTVASRLAGRPRRVYHRGQSWIERPGAHHLLTANTSRTRSARLLVVFVSHTGDRLKVDDPPKGRGR